MAFAGFNPFGQEFVQLIIVWHLYNFNSSETFFNLKDPIHEIN